MSQYNLRRFVYRQITTKDTVKKAEKEAEKLIDGREVSPSLSHHLTQELDNNLKFLKNLIILSPDIAIWQCIKSSASRTAISEDHQVIAYCHGKVKIETWHQPPQKYNRGAPDQSIKEVINAKYVQSDTSITVECTIVKNLATVEPIPFIHIFPVEKQSEKKDT